MFSYVTRFAALVTLFLFQANYAQPLSDVNPDSALIAAVSQITGTPLTLNDALSQGMANAEEVRMAKADYDAAHGALFSERGRFDPELFARIERSEEEIPSSSPFTGADVLNPKTNTTRAGARITLPIGTEVEASLNAVKTETNSIYASLNPQYDARGELSVRQPLLQGFGSAANEEFMAAKAARDAAQARYDGVVWETKTHIISAYWDLYAALRDLAVQKAIRESAQAVHDVATMRSNVGLVGPNQVANAQAFLAQQELAVLDAQQQLDFASDFLSSLIGMRPDDARFLPSDNPPSDFPVVPMDSLVARAERNNYELRAVREDIRQLRVRDRAARWNLLPQLDVIGTIGGNGLAGTGRDVIFGTDTLRNDRNDKMNEAISQAINRDYPLWRLGVEVTIPLGLREGRGERKRTKALLERMIAYSDFLTNDVKDRVRIQYRELESGEARLAAARAGVDASKEQVRIGMIQYENGQTTAFELVSLGSDLADAERRFSAALVRNAKAAAILDMLTVGGYSELVQP